MWDRSLWHYQITSNACICRFSHIPQIALPLNTHIDAGWVQTCTPAVDAYFSAQQVIQTPTVECSCRSSPTLLCLDNDNTNRAPQVPKTTTFYTHDIAIYAYQDNGPVRIRQNNAVKIRPRTGICLREPRPRFFDQYFNHALRGFQHILSNGQRSNCNKGQYLIHNEFFQGICASQSGQPSLKLCPKINIQRSPISWHCLSVLCGFTLKMLSKRFNYAVYSHNYETRSQSGPRK
ncbi:hypothetical protein V8C42DRAFT_316677 [Trichoderma barbatum]